MKYLLFNLLLILSSQLYAQEPDKEDIYSSSLNIGEMLNFGNNSLKFKNVISDSRCPKDVSCVWAGEAKVAVELFVNGECIKAEIISVQSSNIPMEFSVGNMTYSIMAMNLTPYPTVNKIGEFKNYVLQMRVRERLEI